MEQRCRVPRSRNNVAAVKTPSGQCFAVVKKTKWCVVTKYAARRHRCVDARDLIGVQRPCVIFV